LRERNAVLKGSVLNWEGVVDEWWSGGPAEVEDMAGDGGGG